MKLNPDALKSECGVDPRFPAHSNVTSIVTEASGLTMSLSTSLDEWLKQPPMSASAADDFAGSLAGDIPDLGLNLTPEDIKWVDLEFLDLASGPPANHHGSAATRHHHGHHSRGAHNPTLAGNFPDIFFDMTSSVGSLGNSSFPGPSGASSLMDEPPTATTLDLETEEKNFLAELFPPSAQIEQVKLLSINQTFEL